MSEFDVDQFKVEQPRVRSTSEARRSNDISKNLMSLRKKLGNDVPDLFFLKGDGQLSKTDEVLFENNQYLSSKDHEVYGKVEAYEDQLIYYVKTYRGNNRGEIVPDPYGMFFKPTDLSVNTDQMGGRFCEYASVTREIFLTYLRYLENRDPRLYKTVDKYFKDGER